MIVRAAAAVIAMACVAPVCDGAEPPDGDPVTITAGAGLARMPNYEGGRDQRDLAFPILNLTLKGDLGILSLGDDGSAPSNIVSLAQWIVGSPDGLAGGLTLDYDGGRRDDRNAGVLHSGSARLRGLGNLSGTLEYGVFAAYVLGFATPSLAVRTAPSRQGHHGTLVDASVDLAMPVAKPWTLTLTPEMIWGSARYMRHYFGVTPTQSADSAFATYLPGAGIKSNALTLAAGYQATRQWSAAANLVLTRLASDAAASPIVERRLALSPSVGIVYAW